MIESREVTRVFRTSRGEVRALEGISLRIERGELIVVRGPSGSGKTTLLLTLGGMLRPTQGKVIFAGRDLYALGEKERARVRAEKIGFVFQMFHLVPYLTALENVLLAARGRPGREAGNLLETFGLAGRERHRPAQLSAGEKQRTALARALVHGPEAVLADEPTGNLDPQNAAQVMEGLEKFHRAGGTVVLVTHGPLAERQASRILQLKGGRLEPA